MPKRKIAIRLLEDAGHSAAADFVRRFIGARGNTSGWEKAFRERFANLQRVLWPNRPPRVESTGDAAHDTPAGSRRHHDSTTVVHSTQDLLAASKSAAALIVISAKVPALVGKMVKLRAELTVGRAPDAGLQVEDDGISRQHCVFRRSSNGHYALGDLGSTNGTFLNGIRVEGATLQDGDKIQVGANTVLKFSIQDQLEDAYHERLYESAQTRFRYKQLSLIARGGMGEVWLAQQTGVEGFKRQVVVKRILPHLTKTPALVEMFRSEARVAARLNHPNIVQVYDFQKADDAYLLVMEHIDGRDLGRVVQRAQASGRPPERSVILRIIADACRGLHFAHTSLDEQGKPQKLVHRDISPQNILIGFDGSVKVADFGIAEQGTAVLAAEGLVPRLQGKVSYMAPEQASGRAVDPRTDIYALGVVLYELLTGLNPLARDTEEETLRAARESSIAPPSKVAVVSTVLDALVMRALAKEPGARFASAEQFQMAIEELLADDGVVATSVQVAQMMERLFRDATEPRSSMPSTPGAETQVGGPEEKPVSTQVRSLDEVVDELAGPKAGSTNPAAVAVLRNAVREAEVALRNVDAKAGRLQRLGAAQEYLGAAERALNDRLKKLDASERAHWVSVLAEVHGKLGPRTVTDKQVHAFLVRGEPPSLKTMAHWLSKDDGPQPEELAETLRVLLGVPLKLRPRMFELGQVRNVLAHRQRYEADRTELHEAAGYLIYATDDGTSVVDITLEQLETIRTLCSAIVHRAGKVPVAAPPEGAA